jgi:cell division cycle 14
MLVFKITPEEAFRPLVPFIDTYTPYRDAGYGPDTYHTSILDCLKGLYKALSIGLFDLDSFIHEEYRFYEKVENGDLNWLCGKFLALASPHDEIPSTMVEYVKRENWIEYDAFIEQSVSQNKKIRYANTNKSLISYSSPVTNNMDIDDVIGDKIVIKQRQRKMIKSVFCIPNLIQYFHQYKVSVLVRLNNKLYLNELI